MSWKKPFGIIRLSCKVGSMRLRLEWPWKARRYKIALDESAQYWYFSCFLLLLPCFSSTYRQTNDDNTRNVSEDCLLFSRIQSLHHFLWVDFHHEENESISSTLHKSEIEHFPGSTSVQVLSPIGIVLGDKLASSRLCGFALAFDRHAKSLASNFQRIFFELNFWGFLLTAVQIRDQFVRAMRDSDPGVRIVLAYRHTSDLNTVFTLWATSCNNQHGPNLGVSLWSNPSVPMLLRHSRQCVLTTSHCICELWEFFSVFRHGMLSDFNNIQKSCIHTKFTHFCLVVITFQFVLHIVAIEDLCEQGHHNPKGTSVLITLGTNEKLDCPLTTVCPVLSWKVSYSSHICATAP